MTISDRDHARLQSKLEAFAFGLAHPDVAAEIKAHLATCDECRERKEMLVPTPLPGEMLGAHLPEALVVGWSRESPKLRGLQRELVRRHLARCHLCREDLALLGHAPELAIVPGLEPSPEVLRLLEPAVPEPKEHRSFWQRLALAWPQTSWAVAATAVLAIVAFNPAIVARLPWNAGRPAAISPGAIAPPDLPVTRPEIALPFIVSEAFVEPREASRGASEAAPVVTVTPAAPVVRVKLGPPDVPLDSVVDVEVRGPAGAVVVRHSLPARDLTGGRILSLGLGRDAKPGLYTVVVTGQRDGRPKTARYEVRVAVRVP